MPSIRTVILLAAGLGGCASSLAQQADMVLLHGTVLTIDARDSVAQAIAIRSGGILAVGTDAQILKLAGKTTRIVDLHGRTATPGMIDTHSHYAEAGAEDLYLIKLDDAAGIPDIVARVKARVALAKPGEWVRGRGWDDGKLAEHRYIYASDLDAVSPDNPVLLTHTSGHYATVNSYALKLAGIDDRTTGPSNGTIDRDASGHTTGVLKEAAIAPVRALLPPFTQDQIKQGILKEIDDLHREGVTAFKDTARPAQWSALQELNESGKLDERVCMLWRAGDSVASAQATLAAIQAASPIPRAYRQGRLAACGAKIFMDGAALAGTAWSYQPWFKNGAVDAGNTGYPAMDPEVYRRMVRLFHQAGISVGTHAIGDRAMDWVVDTYALVEKEKPIPGLRHSIIHANFPTPHALDVMAALQAQYDAGYPEVQPVFLWWFGQSWLPTLGADRLGLVFPLNTFSRRGIHWSSGTDYGVAPLAPRYGLWAAVQRETLDGKHPFDPTQRVDIHTALRSYTAAAAPQLFLEQQIGSLEPGKRADIAVWDRNPYTIASADLKNLKCEMTIVDGKTVYSSPEPTTTQ
ncbi:MAG: amidohydrolase [Acidobacteriota bacterium]|nr:amidohydrolase [Acidobacteriota bacterium]